MKSYLFDVGNSSSGPVGLCARIVADSAEEAIEKLRDILGDEPVTIAGGEGIEYCNVYTNPNAVTLGDICEVEELE